MNSVGVPHPAKRHHNELKKQKLNHALKDDLINLICPKCSNNYKGTSIEKEL